MYRTSVASSAESEEILAFLAGRGVLENVWLLSSIHNAFRWPQDCVAVIMCRRDDRIVGVTWILYQARVPDEQRAPGYKPDHDYHMQMEAMDRRAIEALIATPPADELGAAYSRRPPIQEYFDGLPGVIRKPGDLYYAVSAERFRPVGGEEVRELTPADAQLFEGCERQPRGEARLRS